ncbi:MAG: 3-phosphoshikimate 1-carboxyvinyltransferase [Chloroflexota bacterium]|jgi:3-phosphoshikimate 1-carboxyvinyltransferase
MARLVVRQQRTPLTGTVTVPGDKSISHRAVMLGALAQGTSAVRDWLPAGDTIATLDIMRALGAKITVDRHTRMAWHLTIEGRGLTGLLEPDGPLNCQNAGTCMRLLAGIMAGQSFASVLDGSQQLRRRPMGRIVKPLRRMGAVVEAEDDRAPLHFRPTRLRGIDYRLPVASAQVKSAILLAGLYADGPTRVMEPGPTRDHTERLLQAMGVPVVKDGAWITMPLATDRRLRPLDLDVPGDLSSAAFLLVTASITPHSRMTIQSVGQNKTRTGLQEILYAMGAEIRLASQRVTGGEPVADLSVNFEELEATTISGETVVRAIDEFPIWAVAATQAAGESQLRDAAELRVKEVDRISLVAAELSKMGAHIVEQPEGMIVTGPTRLQGARVDSHGDHRLGMALAVAGLVAAGETTVEDAGCIADSFPGFVDVMKSLGADLELIE